MFGKGFVDRFYSMSGKEYGQVSGKKTGGWRRAALVFSLAVMLAVPAGAGIAGAEEAAKTEEASDAAPEVTTGAKTDTQKKKMSAVEKLAVKRLNKLKADKKTLKNLRKAFKWSASLRFKNQNVSKKGKAAANYYGQYGFKMKAGDCNTAAFTFYWMAKMLGYDATAIQGYVPDTSLDDLKPHAWVMIKIGKTTWFFDPDLNRAKAGKWANTMSGRKKLGKYVGFKFKFGAPGTYVYHDAKKKMMGKLKK